MGKRGYLTPESIPADTICRVLFIPNDRQIIANVTGALNELIEPLNWQEYGAITPDEIAEALVEMFDSFCFSKGVCHMVGEIIIWSGSDEPNNSNLLLCDGSLLSNEDYPDLWNVIGTTYGGTGATSFALPDLRGKVAIGQNGSHALASTGGAETHTLTLDEIPSHSHLYIPPTINVDVEAPGVPDPLAAGLGIPTNTGNAGGGQSHNNMQPYLTLNYYIVAA